MKRVWMISLLVLSVGSLAQETGRRDGNWWMTISPVQKLDYMVGFFDGMDLGHSFSYWGLYNENGKSKDQNCTSATVQSYEDYDTKFFKNVTNGQLVEGLDSFFKDYRNRRIRVSNAVWLVVNSIAGTPKNELDKMTETWRQNAANN